MSWMETLASTYDACAERVGYSKEGDAIFPPMFHAVKKIPVELCINMEGDLDRTVSGRLLEGDDQWTIVPATDEALSRTSAMCPYPLFDSLEYMAGDFADLNGVQQSAHYAAYMAGLDAWCHFSPDLEALGALQKYVARGTLTQDLIDLGLLQKSGATVLLCQELKKKLPGGDPRKLWVRIRVLSSKDIGACDSPWRDRRFWDEYGRFRLAQAKERDLCYVSGHSEAPMLLHPKVMAIVGAANTKLISSNDDVNYTYRGRFETPEQAACVGSETAHKAYSALTWLLDRQSYRDQIQAFVVWGTAGQKIPPTLGDSHDIEALVTDDSLSGDPMEQEVSIPFDAEHFVSKKFVQAIRGYGSKLGDGSRVVVLGLDSATPGRLSVVYYREMQGSDFLAKLVGWHISCAWRHRYRNVLVRSEGEKERYERIIFMGAPAPDDIALACLGEKEMRAKNDGGRKERRRFVSRLVPCILEGAPIPRDIVQRLFRRACRPVALEEWEFEKVSTIACAVIRKTQNDEQVPTGKCQKNGEEYWTMALDREQEDRSYLMGRLLAHYREAESLALYLRDGASSTRRLTNAERLMTAFVTKPFKTWQILEGKMNYCWRILASHSNWVGTKLKLERGIAELASRLDNRSLAILNARLEPPFILGYRSQLEAFEEARLRRKEESQNIVGTTDAPENEGGEQA